MGAVRIYKIPPVTRNGSIYVWAVRSHGCDEQDSYYCNYGEDHGGHCNDFSFFEYVIYNLNEPDADLAYFLREGAY